MYSISRDIDINNNNINIISNKIYGSLLDQFINYIHKIINASLDNLVIKSNNDIITNGMPICSSRDAHIYAYEYLIKNKNIIYNDYSYVLDLLLTYNYDIYDNYMNLLKLKNNGKPAMYNHIYALEILQQAIVKYIVLINHEYAYNNHFIEDNIYILTLCLCSKLSKYNLNDKFVQLYYPYKEMQWIHLVKKRIKYDNSVVYIDPLSNNITQIIKEFRFLANATIIGFIQYIINFILKKSIYL